MHLFSPRAAYSSYLILLDFKDVAIINDECRPWVQHSRINLKTLGARKVTWSKSNAGKKSFLCPYHNGILGGGRIGPLILNLGTRWRWVVNITPRLLYPGQELWYPLSIKLGYPQSVWTFQRTQNLLPNVCRYPFPYWAPTKTRHHRRRFSRPGSLAPGSCTSLVWIMKWLLMLFVLLPCCLTSNNSF